MTFMDMGGSVSRFKIGFFCSDSNYSMFTDMFQDALSSHPSVDSVDWEGAFSKFGKQVQPSVGRQYLIDNILKYDLIFIELEGIPPLLELFGTLSLWNKVIVYDSKDDQKIVEPISYVVSTEYVDKCLLYIKRSWDERYLPKDCTNMIPLDFCILNSYLDVIPRDYYSLRDLTITSTFLQGNRFNVPRDILTQAIKSTDWPSVNDQVSQVTLFCSTGQQISGGHTFYRRELNPTPPSINWWYVYMHILSRTKMLFTATSHSATGDTRTWEAFSRGPLVFIDSIPIPQLNPLIQGKHYIQVDINNIHKTIELAKELLKDELERAKISKAGYEHAIQYHSSKARIDYVMGEIFKRLEAKKNV